MQGGRAEDVEDGDDILVVEVPKQLDFAKRPEAKHAVVEWGDAFYGHLALGGLVNGRASW